MTTRQKLVAFYAERNQIKNPKVAEEKINRFINALKTALSENENIIFRKFGSFEVRKTTERYIVDPKNRNNLIHAKPRKYVKFKVSRNWEDELCLNEKEKTTGNNGSE